VRREENVLGEGGHHLTRVGGDQTRQGGDGAGDGRLAQEADDADLRQAAVVDLDEASPGLSLLGPVLGLAKGVWIRNRGDGVGG